MVSISGCKFRDPSICDVYKDPIKVKSVHFIGEKDWPKVHSEELASVFDEPLIIRHPQGHTVPRLGSHSSQIFCSIYLHGISKNCLLFCWPCLCIVISRWLSDIFFRRWGICKTAFWMELIMRPRRPLRCRCHEAFRKTVWQGGYWCEIRRKPDESLRHDHFHGVVAFETCSNLLWSE
jgi:uncharacterized protein YcgL (UPF0745 family)